MAQLSPGLAPDVAWYNGHRPGNPPHDSEPEYRLQASVLVRVIMALRGYLSA
jgi:hypothetical protein